MTYEVSIKKCGSIVQTIIADAFNALQAIEIAEKQYPVKSHQVLLGNRPVLWNGLEFEARRVIS